ncbi:HIT family protein [Nonomuraea sp. NPDC050786]|uniref:HIT family protein n=1 Tax=Nonomuraea sp. NPDC050786 TaxID=3154840 RepID=UPI0033CF5802
MKTLGIQPVYSAAEGAGATVNGEAIGASRTETMHCCIVLWGAQFRCSSADWGSRIGHMSECPFCLIGAGAVDRDLVAYRTENVFVIPVPWQRAKNMGHCLVLPREHVTDLYSADRNLITELFDVVARVSAAAPKAFGASGSTIQQNNTIPDQVLHHLHVHVIPRSIGDAFKQPDITTKSEIPYAARVEQAAALRAALSGL